MLILCSRALPHTGTQKQGYVCTVSSCHKNCKAENSILKEKSDMRRTNQQSAEIKHSDLLWPFPFEILLGAVLEGEWHLSLTPPNLIAQSYDPARTVAEPQPHHGIEGKRAGRELKRLVCVFSWVSEWKEGHFTYNGWPVANSQRRCSLKGTIMHSLTKKSLLCCAIARNMNWEELLRHYFGGKLKSAVMLGLI